MVNEVNVNEKKEVQEVKNQFDIKEFMGKKEHKAEFRDKEIIFKPIPSGDAMVFLDKVLNSDTLTVINDEEFLQIGSESLGISVDDFKQTYPAFRIFVVEQLLEVIDFDFFLERMANLAKKVETIAKKLSPSET